MPSDDKIDELLCALDATIADFDGSGPSSPPEYGIDFAADTVEALRGDIRAWLRSLGVSA